MSGNQKKASDLFIECLESEGVEYIFGVPGEENLDFLESLSSSKQIRLVLTRHEQGAGFMAATCRQSSWASALKSSVRATKSVSQRSSTNTPTFPLA